MVVNCNRRQFVALLTSSSAFLSEPVMANIIIKPSSYEGSIHRSDISPMEIALTWKGVDEKNKSDRQLLMSYFYTHLNKEIDPIKVPWCAAFLDCVLSEAGKPKLNTLWARDFLKYGNAVNTVPKKGDLVVLKRKVNYGHVGFFTRFIKDKNGKEWIGVFGGNSGGKVQNSYYSLDKILGIRRV